MLTGTYTDIESQSPPREPQLGKIGYVLVKVPRRGKQDVKKRRATGRGKQSDVATFAYKFAVCVLGWFADSEAS